MARDWSDVPLEEIENDPFWEAAAERAKDDDGCLWLLLVSLALPAVAAVAGVVGAVA